MPVKRRFRLVSSGTWQDGLEFFVPLAIGMFSHFSATNWVLPLVVFPVVTFHLIQLAIFLTVPDPKIEWSVIVMLVDLLAFGAQFLVHYGYLGPEFRIDSVKDDSSTQNLVKLGLLAGLLLIDFIRVWQFYDMDNDLDEDEVAMEKASIDQRVRMALSNILQQQQQRQAPMLTHASRLRSVQW